MFSKTCVERLNGVCQTDYVEILFNPVERMLVVRSCTADTENAIAWSNKHNGARVLSRIFYEAMDWDAEYSYKIPSSLLTHGNNAVLVFDMDNFIGIAPNKKEAIVPAQNLEEKETVREDGEDTKGIFYGPEDEEPQPIAEMEEKFREMREQENKLYGTPAFQYQGNIRGFETPEDDSGVWDMLAPACPLDHDHSVDKETVEEMLQEIVNNPPQIQQKKKRGDILADVIIGDAMILDEDEQGDEP